MNKSIQEYRILLSGSPAKAEKQLYKLTKKGDLQALAALGDVDGIVKVGRAHLNGIGVPVDYEKSLHFFEMAASQNHLEAMILIAYQYQNGKGAAIDYEKPLQWLAQAEQSCHLWLEQELSEKNRQYYEALLQDVDNKRKHCESVSCVELIGNENCPMEQRQKALEYYLMAAENGSTGAMNNIGNFYFHEKGVAKDYNKAFEWYKKATDLSGNSAAECSLGMCYQYGYGTAVDYEKARSLYGMSAKQGLGLAFYRLGLLYEQGLGVAQDMRMAKQYFSEALHRGCREAAFKL